MTKLNYFFILQFIYLIIYLENCFKHEGEERWTFKEIQIFLNNILKKSNIKTIFF